MSVLWWVGGDGPGFVVFIYIFPLLPGMFSLRSEFYSSLLMFYNPILPENWELKAGRRNNYMDTAYTLVHIVFNIP